MAKTPLIGIALLQYSGEVKETIENNKLEQLINGHGHIEDNFYIFGVFEFKRKLDKNFFLDRMIAYYSIGSELRDRELARHYLVVKQLIKYWYGDYILHREPTFNQGVLDMLKVIPTPFVKRVKNVQEVAPVEPVVNDEPVHKKRKNPLYLGEDHTHMRRVTSKKLDGQRQMKETPNQWGLASEPYWYQDFAFKDFKSFEEIVEALRKRQRPEKIAIQWREDLSGSRTVFGQGLTRSFKIHIMQVTPSPQWEFGLSIQVWYRDYKGIDHPVKGFHTSLFNAMAYCQDHLSENVVKPTKSIHYLND